MDLKLDIIFIDHTNNVSSVLVETNKNNLITQSEFFNLLYENAHNDVDDNTAKIDLRHNGERYNQEIIIKFFNILNEIPFENGLYTYAMQKIVYQYVNAPVEFGLEKNSITYSLLPETLVKFNFGLGYDITFSDMFKLSQLCEYFLTDGLLKFLTDFIKKFPLFLDSLKNLDFNETYYLCITGMQQTHKKAIINKSNLHTDIILYREKFIIEQFIENIYDFFIFYNKNDCGDTFLDIIKIINKKKSEYKNFTYFKNIDKTIKQIDILTDKLKQYPLEISFKLLNCIPHNLKNNNPVFKLYDFYDILTYEKSNFKCFTYKCSTNCTNKICIDNHDEYVNDVVDEDEDEDDIESGEYNGKDDVVDEDDIKNEDDIDDEEDDTYDIEEEEEKDSDEAEDYKYKYYNDTKAICKKDIHKCFTGDNIKPNLNIGKKSIITYEEFLKLFHTKTNGVFKDFNWDNVVLSGGFLYGLLDNLSDTSLLPSSDIDLFVYGSEQSIIDKTEELLIFFSKFKPYYVMNGKITTLIIPSLNYDIQIISFLHYSPNHIIKEFDYNYVKSYFNGKDIFCTLDSLIGMKYKIGIMTTTIANQSDKINIIRLYKTIIKGFKIAYNKEIKFEGIVNTFINLCKYHIDDTIESSLNKSITIRKLTPILLQYEIIPVIKSCYNTQHVTTNINNVKYSSKNINNEYNFLETTTYEQINPADIIKIKFLKEMERINYYSFVTNHNSFHNITLDTGYCNFILNRNHDKYQLLLDKFNDDVTNKLVALHNKLRKFLPDLTKTDEHKFYFCKRNDSMKKIGGVDIKTIQIKAHFDENLKNYNKIIDCIQSLDPRIDTIKVILRGQLWCCKGNCGIKLWVDTVKCNRQYNIL